MFFSSDFMHLLSINCYIAFILCLYEFSLFLFIDVCNLLHFQIHKLNVCCSPKETREILQSLNQSQTKYVIAKGFGYLFEMTLEGLETRELFHWLLDLTDPCDMTIRCGPGKELKITKDVIHFITGLSNSGGLPEKFDWSSQVAEAASFQQNFHLSKGVIGVDRMEAEVIKGGADDQTIRCLFLIVFNRLLFCKGTHEITNEHITWTKDIQHFAEFDWCQLIYNDLCHAVRKWHNRDRSQVTATVYRCFIVILVSPCIQSFIICFLSLD
jgi:hypothetical protein